jgi:hypothetical protein
MLINTVCCCFPQQEEMRETTADDFRYEDLERLPTEELARITEWLTEKVDALSTRLKAEPKEDEVRVCVCVCFGFRVLEAEVVFELPGWGHHKPVCSLQTL